MLTQLPLIQNRHRFPGYDLELLAAVSEKFKERVRGNCQEKEESHQEKKVEKEADVLGDKRVAGIVLRG